MDSSPLSSAETSSSRSNTYIESRKPSGSSILWAHLLRKDVLVNPTKNNNSLPPFAPIDKSSTSTRILLLDTQANLQKFGQTVEDLTLKVDHARQEIVTVKTLFEQDRELLTSDFVDRLNRTQLELQKSLGSPAQASKLAEFEKNVQLRLDGMDQRLNAIQMLNQTYSQTLQNQTQVLQFIQDQQSTIIAALTPLLPLLQTIPQLIESARNNLSESLSKSVQSIQLSVHKNILSSPARKRSNSFSFSERKRRRLGENGDLPPPITGRMPLSTKVVTSPNHFRNNPNSATRLRKVSALMQISNRPPLVELSLTNYGIRTTEGLVSSPSAANVPYPETPQTIIMGKTPSSSCDPLARFHQGNHSPKLRSAIERSPTVSVADAQLSSPYISTTAPVPDAKTTVPVNINTQYVPRMPKLMPFSVPKTKPLVRNDTNTNSLSHAPASATPVGNEHGSVPRGVHGIQGLASSTRTSCYPRQPNFHHHQVQVQSSGQPATPALPSASDINGSTATILIPPTTLRRRRSPFREGRRFIPLDDSDSEDERQT